MRNFEKEKFLKTELGVNLEECVTSWNYALKRMKEVDYESGVYKMMEDTLRHCQSQWEVYQMLIKQFYSVEYFIFYDNEYFGICTQDRNEWLIKVER